VGTSRSTIFMSSGGTSHGRRFRTIARYNLRFVSTERPTNMMISTLAAARARAVGEDAESGD
jgi:hypothetical protein